MSELDVEPLARATTRLAEGLARWQSVPDDLQLRDGLIQRFEFTYELSHRMIRRFLKLTSAVPEEVDALAFADLIRQANRQELLLGSWPEWRRYCEMRVRSSHSYAEETAHQVLDVIPQFLAEAQFLLTRLRGHTL